MRVFAALVCLLLCLPVLAESRLTLTADHASLRGEWETPLANLDRVLHLDADRDGAVAWAELEPRRADIERYLREHLEVAVQGASAAIEFSELIYGARDGQPSILARLTIGGVRDVAAIGIRYSLGDHCIVKVVWSGLGMHEATITAPSGALSFTRESAAGSGFLAFLEEGVFHIWTGYDHVLFLLVLLIPAATFKRVFLIVSAFTIAHSITLTCAALQWISLPSRLVESAIAASIFVAALLNFLPATAGWRGAGLAFGFGLLHGFGFADALTELDTEGAPLWRTLLAFNLGVEAGQLVIVAAFLPLAHLLRNTRFYRTGVVYGGSTIAGLCALVWFWQRAFV
jgi:hypothetical protein